MPPTEATSPTRVPTPAKTAAPFTDFDDAALPILSALRASIGFDLWMVTRLAKSELVVTLHAGLDDSRIKHSMGFRLREPQGGLPEAWHEATQRLGQPVSAAVAAGSA